jgi:hypothetical protein
MVGEVMEPITGLLRAAGTIGGTILGYYLGKSKTQDRRLRMVLQVKPIKRKSLVYSM